MAVYTLGVNGWAAGAHDPSVALFRDGTLIYAVEEERFLRVKHAFDVFPHESIDRALHAAGITAGDLHHLVVGWDLDHLLQYSSGVSQARITPEAALDLYLPRHRFPERIGRAIDVSSVPHHESHAAGAFFASPFDDALVLVIDGSGEYESTTLFSASRSAGLELVQSFGFEQSLGIFYEALTAYLGFGRFHEGKVMGLAAHGIPRFEFPELDLAADPPQRIQTAREDERAFLSRWESFFVATTGCNRFRPPLRRDRRTGRRRPDLSEPTQQQKDIAASAQAWLEAQVCRLVTSGMKQTGQTNVVITGGVALNCPANFRVLQLENCTGVYVPPAPGDAGVAVGAAASYLHQRGESPIIDDCHCYAGPRFTTTDIAALLRHYGWHYAEYDEPERAVAELLAEGKVVGCFQGGLEFGPRALGHRSILADPTIEGIRDRVNVIKGRELWRPLAPSIKAESTRQYFEQEVASPFMSFSVPLREATQEQAPAVAHADGSARLQTVSRVTAPEYWSLIDHLERLKGVPMVMNTSFNVGPEPLVASPEDALRTFAGSGLDALAIDHFVVRKDALR